jgi:parvulin-like peptidyl-prolyl isomerase
MRRPQSRIPIAFIVLATALVAAVWLAGCGDSGGPETDGAPSDPVVLHVNGKALHRSQLDAVRAELRLGGTSDAETRAEKELVRRELIRQEADRLDVAADADQVETRRASMVSQVGGEQALAALLKRIPMTDAQLRSGLHDGVLRDALQDAKYDEIDASRAEARAFFARNRASFRQEGSAHLWAVQVPAERIAESAIHRLKTGHSFAEVARQFSSDPQAKDQGGDMGVVALSSLPEPLSKAIRRTPPGQITDPVQGPGGWYVLKATDLKPTRTRSFAEVEKGLVAELTRRARFKALDAWLDAARERATVTRP